MANEIQRLYFGSQSSPISSSSLEVGTYTLTFNNETTSSLEYSDNNSAIQTAMEALTSIGAGNITVTTESDGFTFEFINDLANQNLPLITLNTSLDFKQAADTISVSNIQNGVAPTYISGTYTNTDISAVSPVDEIQIIHLSGATTGTFDLTYSDNSTTATVYSLDASGVQSAVSSLLGMDFFFTDLGGGDYKIEFFGANGGNKSGLYVSSNSTDSYPWVEVTQDGAEGVSQVDAITFTGSVNGGYMYLDGQYLDYSSDASGLSISGATASGTPASGIIYIYWSDYSNHGPLSTDGSNLIETSGAYQILSVSLTDNPDEGSIDVVLNGYSSGTFNYDGNPSVFGWTTTTSSTNYWEFTRDIQESDASYSVNEMSSLRKLISFEIVTIQEGVDNTVYPSNPNMDVFKSFIEGF
jgi:hypothetical protein